LGVFSRSGVVPEIKEISVAEKTVKQNKADKPKQPNAIARWWRETIGELRKVSWPTPPEAWRLTKIVLVVMFLMSALLGFLDYIFSTVISLVLG
jgi:preprotein translocase subunit SecE